MLEVFTTAYVDNQSFPLFGRIDERGGKIWLNCQTHNKAANDFAREIMYQKKMDIQMLDTDGKAYRVCGCKFISVRRHLVKAQIANIEGEFERLIQEDESDAEYDMVWFSFTSIDELFSYERFETKLESEGNALCFTKERRRVLECEFTDGIRCFVQSSFKGIKRSVSLHNLDVKQRKMIRLEFSDKKSVDDILSYVIKIKSYFEFILQREIGIEHVMFRNAEASGGSKLIYDPILIPMTRIRECKSDNHFEETALIDGLKSWMNCYDDYRNAIKIWQKTIYNQSVTEEDLYLWRCQTFEIICTITKEIYEKSKSYMGQRQTSPNIRNILEAVSDIYKVTTFEEKEVYFADAKRVRDKLTHNNPAKTISEVQRSNSFRLIDFIIKVIMSRIIGIPPIPASLALIPQVQPKVEQ